VFWFACHADLEQVLFALSTAAAHGQQLSAVQLSLYPNLLQDARKQDSTAAAGGGVQAQQQLSEVQVQPVTVNIQEAKTWEVCDLASWRQVYALACTLKKLHSAAAVVAVSQVELLHKHKRSTLPEQLADKDRVRCLCASSCSLQQQISKAELVHVSKQFRVLDWDCPCHAL
jgi:hypothetical protein